MTIRYQCVECDATMKIKDEKAGTKGHCPKCKAEFIVPSPEGEETAEAGASATPAAPRKVAATEQELEDEFQAILMGGNPKESKASRSAADSDTNLTSTTDDPPTRTGFSESDTDLPARPATTGAKPRGKTTAEISAAMMKNTAEPTLKKTGKPFGEGNNDKVSAQSKAAAQARAYYTKQIGLGSLVVIVVCYGLYALMSSMMGGPKLPPLARVTGKVTLDGKPLSAATVMFQPILEGPKANTKQGGSVGITDKEGHFDMQYVEGVHGAVLGKHSVQIRATNDVGLEIVPPKYNHNSQLTYEVSSGAKPADFALTSK